MRPGGSGVVLPHDAVLVLSQQSQGHEHDSFLAPSGFSGD
jgi:hypothetical protein